MSDKARRALAGAILRIHVWAARHHRPDPGYNRCAECHDVWPCRVRRETDERVDRFCEGCCSSCDGLGVGGPASAPETNGRCADCRGTGHLH